MKKFIIGIGVAAVFLAYSHVLRGQHSEPVVAPSALSQNNSGGATSAPTTPVPGRQYKDGTYAGSVENAFYGDVQVSATIAGGKITAVNFLESPDENPNSIYVNSAAMPYLKQEAIKAQSSHVSIVTGATYTSQAFEQSLASALSQAAQS